MAELLKCFRNLHSNNGDCVFDAVMYEDNVGQTETASFVIGYNFDTDADPLSISGISTLSDNIYLQLDSNSTGVPVASTIDSFVFYDAILTTEIGSGQVSIIQ
jgi:hypothetical protein